MTQPNLITLAERVEAASGPDRELDNAIYHDVLGFCRHLNTEYSGYQDDTGFDCLDCGADSWGNKSRLGDFPKGQGLHDKAPEFTASLDAAMTLVPEGTAVELRIFTTGAASAIIWRSVTAPELPFEIHCQRAATPALALTAAALRARASL